MEIAILFFLTSGLFLGWALGANDAANIFGTAVGTRMVTFATAAIICSIFVTLGAVISGAGAAYTLGKLGAVNALGGSFMAAFSAGLSVYMMTRAGVPVSTSQAIVGAIIGWNLFSGTVTDSGALIKIITTWVVCPVLAAVISIIIFKFITWLLKALNLHLFRVDAYTRIGLILAGAFGAYSLGANNIANVMGVFVSSSPFTDFSFYGLFSFSSVQQLFLLGALAIAVGILTYSKRVMLTVGGGLLPLTPVAAWVVVISHSIVLFLFASQGLEAFLASRGLPTIPLVPVSSSQAVIGAVIGIGILKGGRAIRWRVLGGISAGWVLTPLIAGLVCFVGLFFLQNVFNQQVFRPVPYELSENVLQRLEDVGVETAPVRDLTGMTFPSGQRLVRAIGQRAELSGADEAKFLTYARVDEITIEPSLIGGLDTGWLSAGQLKAVKDFAGQKFYHKWMLGDALARQNTEWKFHQDSKINKSYNKELKRKLDLVNRTFRVKKD